MEVANKNCFYEMVDTAIMFNFLNLTEKLDPGANTAKCYRFFVDRGLLVLSVLRIERTFKARAQIDFTDHPRSPEPAGGSTGVDVTFSF